MKSPLPSNTGSKQMIVALTSSRCLGQIHLMPLLALVKSIITVNVDLYLADDAMHCPEHEVFDPQIGVFISCNAFCVPFPHPSHECQEICPDTYDCIVKYLTRSTDAPPVTNSSVAVVTTQDATAPTQNNSLIIPLGVSACLLLVVVVVLVLVICFKKRTKESTSCAENELLEPPLIGDNRQKDNINTSDNVNIPLMEKISPSDAGPQVESIVPSLSSLEPVSLHSAGSLPHVHTMSEVGSLAQVGNISRGGSRGTHERSLSGMNLDSRTSPAGYDNQPDSTRNATHSVPSLAQRTTPSPPDLVQRTTPSPPNPAQRTTPCPPTLGQRTTPSPPNSAQRTTPSPPNLAQRTTPCPPTLGQRTTPSPPDLAQRTTPSPPDLAQRTTPSPQNSYHRTTPSPPNTTEHTTPSLPYPAEHTTPSPPNSAEHSTPSPPNSTEHATPSLRNPAQRTTPSPPNPIQLATHSSPPAAPSHEDPERPTTTSASSSHRDMELPAAQSPWERPAQPPRSHHDSLDRLPSLSDNDSAFNISFTASPCGSLGNLSQGSIPTLGPLSLTRAVFDPDPDQTIPKEPNDSLRRGVC